MSATAVSYLARLIFVFFLAVSLIYFYSDLVTLNALFDVWVIGFEDDCDDIPGPSGWMVFDEASEIVAARDYDERGLHGVSKAITSRSGIDFLNVA